MIHTEHSEPLTSNKLSLIMKENQCGNCAFLSRSMVRTSQSGQQVSSSRVMIAKASMDPLSYRNTWGTNSKQVTCPDIKPETQRVISFCDKFKRMQFKSTTVRVLTHQGDGQPQCLAIESISCVVFTVHSSQLVLVSPCWWLFSQVGMLNWHWDHQWKKTLWLAVVVRKYNPGS